MGHTVLIVILITIGTLAIISVFLGLLNWISLSSTSTLINQLQSEIEKKYKELDTIKKEYPSISGYTTPVSPANNSVPYQPVSPANDSVPYEQTQNQDASGEEQQIEIVRNVRGDFTNTKQSNLQHQTYDISPHVPDPAIPALPASDFLQEPEYRQTPLSPLPEQIEETTAVTSLYPDDTFEKITVNQHPTSYQSSFLTIPLYSPASQDADFNLLYKTLVPVLQSKGPVSVAIDLKNILFLYNQEIAYLCKIYTAVASHHGTLSFVNCGPELISILKKDPLLSTLSMKEE